MRFMKLLNKKNMQNLQSDRGAVSFEGSPDKCPFCHKTITPTPLYGHINGDILEVVLICPNLLCRRSFIGYYKYYAQYYKYSGETTIGNFVSKEFSDTVSTISQDFIYIYNQAYASEQNGLKEICGVGYRKALEFLIKDYIIIKNPSEKEKIERKLLGPCITEYVDDERIKTVSKRAVWLGNDETHYIRKWEGRSLEDLKKLIDLTVHWIEMEALTISFENEMPE